MESIYTDIIDFLINLPPFSSKLVIQMVDELILIKLRNKEINLTKKEFYEQYISIKNRLHSYVYNNFNNFDILKNLEIVVGHGNFNRYLPSFVVEVD